jgi:hypothetical protein
MNKFTIDINRIILTGLGLAPDRAERIRAMTETELQRLLEKEGLPDDLMSNELAGINTPTLHLSETQSDLTLASNLARNIANSLQSGSQT